MARWSALPTWWTRQLGLGSFLGGSHAGASIAALKVLMSLAVLMNFQTRKAKASVSELEALSGLSRPMVLKGIELLEELDMVRVDREGHINEYELTVAPSDANWAKLPHDLLRLRLKELANRGVVPLSALKIYLQLVAKRPNDSPSIAMSHQKLRDDTGIQKRHIRPALDVLFSHGLLRLEQVDVEVEKVRHNVYRIMGL